MATVRELVVPAWELITRGSLIKKFNLIPSIVSTGWLCFIVVYQTAYAVAYLGNLKHEALTLVLNAVSGFAKSAYFVPGVAVIAIAAISYMFLIPVGEIGRIALVDRFVERDEKGYRHGNAFSKSILFFLPVFEFHNLMSLFQLASVTTFYLLLLRVFDGAYFWPITATMAAYFLFSCAINAIFSYTRFFIVFKGAKAFEAMGKSVKFAVENLELTFSTYFSLFHVSLRIFLSAAGFVAFPFLVSYVLSNVDVPFLRTAALAGIGALLLGSFAILAHLDSVLEIFSDAVWYNAYKDCLSRAPKDDEEE